MKKLSRMFYVFLSTVLALCAVVGCSSVDKPDSLPKLTAPYVNVSETGEATWNSVPYAQYYVYKINNGDEKFTDERSVQLSPNQTIKVKAISGSESYADSDYSQAAVYIEHVVQTIKLAAPSVTVDSNGLATWNAVPNAQSYVYTINNGEERTTSNCTVQLDDKQTIRVKAIGGSSEYTDSDFSTPVTYVRGAIQPTKLATPQVSVDSNGLATWNVVPNAQSYVYTINNGAERTTSNRTVQLAVNQTIRVKAVGDGINYANSDYSQPASYTNSGTVHATKLAAPSVTVDSNGLATWNSVPNAQSYIYIIDSGAEASTTSRSVQLSANQSVKVKAVGDGINYTDSDYSQTATYTKVIIPDNTNSQEVRQYYSGITAVRGDELLGQIHDLITGTHTTYSSYNDCKTPSIVVKTDAGSSSAYVMDFYTQQDISKTWNGNNQGTWNREHVWCKSLSNGLWNSVDNSTRNGGTDLHHLRPSEVKLNSTRGNLKFGEFADSDRAYVAYFIDTNGTQKYQGGLYTGSKFEPLDIVKGDVARIVFYVYTHYNTYANVHGTTNGNGPSSNFGTLKFTHIMAPSSEAAAIELLLQWNAADPVDDIEIARNEAVYEIQGNRNPFIDHPEYANAIWGSNG